jgi:3',5'-cyclic AMP phosphodiesterase CpdA
VTTAARPRLLAISDLHISHRQNREALKALGDYPDDWLIVAGDAGESAEHLRLALAEIAPRFARVFWVPGNHELWCPAGDSSRSRGQARYDELVAICREFGVISPDDPYVRWPGDDDTYIVPMFLLYDYGFRPADVPLADAVNWARATGVLCGDERLLPFTPWPSRQAWCHARVALTEARLQELPAGARTVLVNHWPLRYDLARPPRVPRFSIWSGTPLTEDWAVRFHARVVVSGHMHFRTTLWRHGVRYEEVSLGYPRDWRVERGIDWYLREILPGDGPHAHRFVPARDPFRGR